MSALDRIPNTPIGMLPRRLVSWLELRLLRNYKRDPREQEGVDAVRAIYDEQRPVFAMLLFGAPATLYNPGDLLNLWQHALSVRGHGGAFAEVGAFRGDSTEVICKAKGVDVFYVFEAFTGLRNAGQYDTRFRSGLFASEEVDLHRRLHRYPNTHIIRGYFPETAAPVADVRFSFVHLDVDLYEDTIAALQFFYPRMLPGGRIISHDYGQCEGVWRAFDEFFAHKPDVVEPTGSVQVLIRKV